jgi:acyl carrier protein
MSDFAADRASLAAWCLNFVAEMLERSPSEINPNVKFSRIGFDSAMSVHLAVALEEHLGIALSPDVLAEHPTIASLVSYLSGLQSKSAP